jgi:Trk K+ transport system NAD-binding subunit
MTGADGEMPVPDGEYTLADGMMVTVAGSTVEIDHQKQR